MRLSLLLGLCLIAAPACKKEAKQAPEDKSPLTAKQPEAPEPPPSSKPEAEQQMPKVGDPAPEFTTVAHDGTEVSVAGLRGEPFVLYFYPRDDTPG